jgi:hypothetical protein
MSYRAHPWAEHPERLQVLAAHGEMLWSLLERFGSRIREEAIFRREMNRYANRATWAATEVKVSSKYDLRYMSEGVFRACERLGDLRTWVGLISPRFGGQRDYAAKAATRVRNSYSIGLR